MRYPTPLRYPGGKQRLAPFIAELMTENGLAGCHYAEPYAGGAGVAIYLLLAGIASHIHLNDSCRPLYAFWKSILFATEEFCRRITATPLTVDEWRRQREILARSDSSQLDLGFSFFYLNRCNRSGIVFRGSLIGGVVQKGKWKIDARFPCNALVKRIEAIAAHRESITIKNWDAERFIEKYLPSLPEQTFTYCDPPYYRAGHLYLNNYTPQDHVRLAKVIQQRLHHPWALSYDDEAAVMKNFSGRQLFRYRLQYNAARVYRGSEIFIVSDGLRLPPRSLVRPIDRALRKLRSGRRSRPMRRSKAQIAK